MGTWSPASFGNDAALEWLGDLKEARDGLAFLAATVGAGMPVEDLIAAGEVIAALNGKAGPDLPDDLAIWCSGKPQPSASLRQAAAEAIQIVLDDPEADVHDAWAELGEDDADYQAWLAGVADLINRLAL